MENKVEIEAIQDLQVKSKVEEVKLPGDDEPSKMLFTTVSFKYEGGPGKLNSLLYAMASDHRVDAIFNSPQMVLDMLKEKHQGEER
jgi:hypothetical protein